MQVFGRDDEIAQLLSSETAVVLIVGDIHVGKTTVLAETQKRDQDSVAPPPVRVMKRPGALQLALLEALGAAVAQLSQDEPLARRAGRIIAGAATRVARARLSGLGSAVAKYLLDIVRAQVGESAASLIEEFSKELSTSLDEQLSNRITNASDGDVIDLIVELSTSVAELANDKQVVLALDSIDQLDDGDRRRLADLAGCLPEGIRLRGTFSTWDKDSRYHTYELNSAGIEIISTRGIDVESIAAWLHTEGLDPGQANAVHRITDGYGMATADAIALLRQGKSIEALKGVTADMTLSARTKLSWSQLAPDTKYAALDLAVLSTPLSFEDAAAFLNLDLRAWQILRDQLVDSAIFTDSGNPWFHELRRTFILEYLIAPETVAHLRASAVKKLSVQLQLPKPTTLALIQFRELAPHVENLMADDEQLAYLTQAAIEEIAIIAAILELSGPQDEKSALNVDTVLLHARAAFGVDGAGLEAGLLSLSESGLISVTGRYYPQVTFAAESEESVWMVAGRAAAELRRAPMPSIAVAFFEAALRPKLGTFCSALYGMGRPSTLSLLADAARQHKQDHDRDDPTEIEPQSVVIRALSHELPLYAIVTYHNSSDSDAAARRISHETILVWDEPLKVLDALTYPSQAIPSKRFMLSARILSGGLYNSSESKVHLTAAGSLDQEMANRHRTISVVRELSSRYEREAYGLTEPLGYLYTGDEHQSVTAQVYGYDGICRVDDDFSRPHADGSYGFQLSRVAGLPLGARAGVVLGRYRSKHIDPVDELKALQGNAYSFNEYQLPVQVTLEEKWLEEHITLSLNRTYKDACILADSLSIPRPPRPIEAHIIIQTDGSQSSISDVLAIMSSASTGASCARVRIIDRASSTFFWDRLQRIPQEVHETFGVTLTEPYEARLGDGHDVLSELLGHYSNEILIYRPSPAR
jgi:hypothetical protein